MRRQGDCGMRLPVYGGRSAAWRYTSGATASRARKPTTRSKPAGSIGSRVRKTLPHGSPEVFHVCIGSLVLSSIAGGWWPAGCSPWSPWSGSASAAGSAFGSSFSLPNTDSQAAVTLLTQNFPSASGEGDQVVIQATHGATIQSAPVRAAVTAALARVAKVPGVESVASPYAKAGAAQVSRDGTVAFARGDLGQAGGDQVTTADARNLINGGGDRRRRRPCTSPSAASPSPTPNGPSPGFIRRRRRDRGAGHPAGRLRRSGARRRCCPCWARGLALVLGTSVIGLLSHAMSISSVSTELAVLIGLGVGVDYGLFIISRHRSAVKDGLLLRRRRGPGRGDLRPHGAVRRPDRLHRAARPVRCSASASSTACRSRPPSRSR